MVKKNSLQWYRRASFWKTAFPLIALLLFSFIGNAWFLSVDQTPTYKEVGHQYISILGARNGLSESSLLQKVKLLYMDTPLAHGPTYQIPAVLVASTFGTSEDTVAMTNAIFMAVLVLSLYALGGRLYSREVGLLAATLVTLYPAVFYISRGVVVDFSLAAMVGLSALWLLKTEGFTDRKASLILGLVFGLAALAKFTFFLFLAIPFLAEMIPEIHKLARKRDYDKLKKRCVNLLLCTALAAALSLPWYVVHLPGFLDAWARINIPNAAEGGSSAGMILNFYLAKGLSNTDMLFLLRGLFSDVLLVVFLSSLIYFAIKGRKRCFVLGWIALPLVFFQIIHSAGVLLSTGSLKYFAPLFPAVALIIASAASASAAVVRSSKSPWRKRLGMLVCILVVLLHLNLYLAVTTSGSVGLMSLIKPLDSLYSIDSTAVPVISPTYDRLQPNPIGLRFDELDSIILKERESRGRPLRFLRFNPENGRLGHAIQYKLAGTIGGREPEFEPTLCQFNAIHTSAGLVRAVQSPESCLNQMRSADVVIIDPTLDDYYQDQPPWDAESKALMKAFFENISGYEHIYAAPLQVERSQIQGYPVIVDYLSSEGEAYGSEAWQEPVNEETVNSFSGLVYLRKE